MARLWPLLASAMMACALLVLPLTGARADSHQRKSTHHRKHHRRHHRKHHRRSQCRHRRRHHCHHRTSARTGPGARTNVTPPANQIYDSRSPFNTAAPASGAGSYSQPLSQSSTWVSKLASGGKWTNDPDQYSKPIYRVDLATSPVRTLKSTGYSFKIYGNGDQSGVSSTCTSCQLHVPSFAVASSGSDGHVV